MFGPASLARRASGKFSSSNPFRQAGPGLFTPPTSSYGYKARVLKPKNLNSVLWGHSGSRSQFSDQFWAGPFLPGFIRELGDTGRAGMRRNEKSGVSALLER
jgi:hypothetical protein